MKDSSPSSLTVGMEYLFAFFNSDVTKFVWKTNEREEGSIVMLIFVICHCLNVCHVVSTGYFYDLF